MENVYRAGMAMFPLIKLAKKLKGVAVGDRPQTWYQQGFH